MKKDSQLIDQQGISFISGMLAKMECGFNEHAREVGIDGIIEFRDEAYHSSGKLIACQVKSGESYFQNETANNYNLYIDKKHIDYWLRCNLPVLFLIFSPEHNDAYWAHIANFNLIEKNKSFLIQIPKEQKLSNTKKDDLYSACFGKLYSKDCDFQKVFTDLYKVSCNETSEISINAYEMFTSGLADNCRQLFFAPSLYVEMMSLKSEDSDLCGSSIPNYDMFFEKYLEALRFHCIIQGDFSFELETYKLDLHPIFLKPLSLNGLRFINFLRENRKEEIYAKCDVTGSISSFNVPNEFSRNSGLSITMNN